MKSLFKLVPSLFISTYVIAGTIPPQVQQLDKDVQEDWNQFFSQLQTTTRADVWHKDQIDNYFLNPLPGYEAFNKWFYKALDNGSKSIYEQIKKSYEDPNFVPQKTLTNTPFPIPTQFQRVYLWLLTQDPSLNQQGTSNDKSVKKLEDHFGVSIKPIFEDFYKWLYNKQKEDADWKQHLVDTNKLSPPRFKALAGTPFPVPKKYHAYYYYEKMHPNNTITRYNYTISSDNTTLDDEKAKEIVNQFFGGAVQPEYEDFYRWFYDKQQDDDQWLRELNLAQHFDFPELLDEFVTPFAIPPKYRSYFILSDIIHPNSTLLDSSQSTLAPQKLPSKNEPTVKDTVNDFFGGTVEPAFRDFYNWFYEKQRDDENWKKEFNMANYLNTADLNLAVTPFPIPDEFHPFFALANVLKPSGNASNPNQKPALATDLDKLLEDANSLENFQEFNNWLNEASPFQKNLLRKACELTLPPLQISDMNTPFPVPAPVRDAFCWAVYHDDDDNTTSDPGAIFYRNELEEFFKRPHLPIHDLFYQWLYDVETDLERAKARLATDQPIKPNFAVWIRSTPFPVPAEHLHHFAYINAVESLLNITTKSKSNKGNAVLEQKQTTPGTGIPGTKAYREFTQWLDEVLNHDQELLAEKIKECQHDLQFNLRKISTPTPFPVPLNHFRFYHWLNAHLDDLKKSPARKATSPRSEKSDSKNKYPEFTQWLNRLFNNDQSEITRQLRECQADLAFQPRNIRVTAPFEVPLHYYRFYHWVNSKLHPEDYTTVEPPVTPKPFVNNPETSNTLLPWERFTNTPYRHNLNVIKVKPQEDEDDDSRPPSTPSYQEFTNWLNEVLSHKRDLITQKMKECQHDRDFRPREVTDPLPFPVPLRFFRFYHWLSSKIKAGKLNEQGIIHTAPAESHATTGRPGISFMTTQAFPEYTQWLFNMFKNDQKQINEKLKECQFDQTFNPRAIKASTPFPVPIRHFRFYHWMNSKLNPDLYKYSANEIPRPSSLVFEPTYTLPKRGAGEENTTTEETTTDPPPPPTKSYLEFTKWLNNILDHDAQLIAQKMKECQHDQKFNPRQVKDETTPFPVPLHHFRFFHWLNAKHKAGEHKKQGIIHTAPANSHATTGRPGISFMTTRAHPEYTQWLFKIFQNDQKKIVEKIHECQQDQTFNPRLLNATTPFPIPIRHFRFFHWMNSKLQSQKPSR